MYEIVSFEENQKQRKFLFEPLNSAIFNEDHMGHRTFYGFAKYFVPPHVVEEQNMKMAAAKKLTAFCKRFVAEGKVPDGFPQLA